MSQVMKEKKQPLVRMDYADKAVLDQLTAKTGESAPRLLHRAVTALKKEIFFQQMNSAYKAMRNDTEGWEAEQADRKLFEKSVHDGLDLK